MDIPDKEFVLHFEHLFDNIDEDDLNPVIN